MLYIIDRLQGDGCLLFIRVESESELKTMVDFDNNYRILARLTENEMAVINSASCCVLGIKV